MLNALAERHRRTRVHRTCSIPPTHFVARFACNSHPLLVADAPRAARFFVARVRTRSRRKRNDVRCVFAGWHRARSVKGCVNDAASHP